ncbi:MAG: hypothetical protein IT495_13385 [Gammaproteobacteria bacterium]|nr:hypothetical protein [Gammaproteobacteria bacterium]
MKIVNYDNFGAALSPLLAIARKEGRTKEYLDGLTSGFHQASPSLPARPNIPQEPKRRKAEAPGFNVRDVNNGVIGISGPTHHFREELKRLGGRWNPTTKEWIFPKRSLPALKNDEELNRLEERGVSLWEAKSAETEEEFAARHRAWTDKAEDYKALMEDWESRVAEYRAGYARGAERRHRTPMGKAFR